MVLFPKCYGPSLSINKLSLRASKNSCETKYSLQHKDTREILHQNSLPIFQYVCDRKIPDNVTGFQQGQAVVAKVTEVDYDRKRFLVSLRMKDCYHGDTDIGINLLDDYLKEYSLIKANYERQKGKWQFETRPQNSCTTASTF